MCKIMNLQITTGVSFEISGRLYKFNALALHENSTIRTVLVRIVYELMFTHLFCCEF